MTEWQGVVPRAQCGDWVWRRSLGQAQRFPRVAAAGVRGGGPCVPPGCPGRAEQPGRLPKVFVQASHGSGAKKMAGLPNFCGAGEGREGRAGCQPWPRLFADPGRRSRGDPPPQKKKTFLGANFPAPATPAAARWTRRVWGIPSAARRREGLAGAADTADGAGATPPGQPRALCRPWRAAKARPASSEVPCTALGRRQRPGGCLPCHPTLSGGGSWL